MHVELKTLLLVLGSTISSGPGCSASTTYMAAAAAAAANERHQEEGHLQNKYCTSS
jgi:hypothetical protein